jgi:NAD(P)-dependent dehydrogenase (short-subunit alcohol dehydrogenase family)
MRIKNSVVVITGASSGIGRATALAFAGRGASVVLAARRKGALEQATQECEALGGRALAIPTDVADFAAVEELARQAADHFGRIDIWVNAAAVTVFSPFPVVPLEDFRRVLDVNVMGCVHGARAAMSLLRAQCRGLIVNVSSVTAIAPQPYATAYTVSKAAVSSLSASLRQELQLAGDRKVKVCTVLPATIDTPFFQHAANYTGRKIQAMPPVYPPERVAHAIVCLARVPRAEVIVGPAGRAADLQARLSRRLLERLMARYVDRYHLSRKEPAPPTSGNLYIPAPETGSVDGGWHGRRRTAARRLVTASALAVLAATMAGHRRRHPRCANRKPWSGKIRVVGPPSRLIADLRHREY